MKVQIKRVYEPPERGDGLRVLIDHIWPRGVRKDEAEIDLWVKDIAPSGELRRWFGHDPARWTVFRTKYRKELDHNAVAVRALLSAAKGRMMSLIYAARDTEHNNAVVLAEYLLSAGNEAGQARSMEN